jgi:hypothetical protein
MRLGYVVIAVASVLAAACNDANAPTAPVATDVLASLSDRADGGGSSRFSRGSIHGMKCLATSDSHRHLYDRYGRCESRHGRSAGIANWPISLSGTDDQGHAVSLSTVTGAKGRYAFTGLRRGKYTVCEGVKDGFVQVFPRTGAGCPGGTFGYRIVLRTNEVVERADFVNRPGGTQPPQPPPPPPTATGNIQGTVLLDGTTIGLSGWAVTLFDGNGVQIVQTASDGAGTYAFTSLTAGTYQVCEALIPGMTPDMVTAPLAGDPGTALCTGNGTIGYRITITAAGEVVTGKDFRNNIAG